MANDSVAQLQQRLQQWRTECGNPSFRELASLFRKLDRPQAHTTIQSKVTGAAVPDWPFVETFVRACGRYAALEGDLDLRPWWDAHILMRRAEGTPPSGEPYRRLDAFGADDTMWFHGRRDAVEQVVTALGGARPAVLVLGPSGAGKSSLVHAGVLPALCDGVLPGSDRWDRVCVRPRQDLFAELDQAGLPTDGAPLSDAVVRRLAGKPADCRLLLVIDQFEELLTAAADAGRERLRQEALTQLATVTGLPRTLLLLVMRDDFYPHLSAQAGDLRARLTLVDLPAALSVAQIDDIIRGPARTAGLIWETQLPELIITDLFADHAAGSARQVPVTVLPVLELTLYQVWARRCGNRLNHDGYRRAGGIRGALTSWCTAALDRFPEVDRDCAGQILTALVRPADPDLAVPAVRRQVPIDTLRQMITLDPGGPNTAGLVDRVLATLTEQRIIATGTLHDSSGRTPVAELVHDSLIRDWPQLIVWVEADHRFQRWLNRAGERHRRWLRHPADDDLLTGTDLTEGVEWAGRRAVPEELARFLRRSRLREQARTRRGRRLNVILAGLLVVALTAIGAATWFSAAIEAEKARNDAGVAAMKSLVAAEFLTRMLDSRIAEYRAFLLNGSEESRRMTETFRITFLETLDDMLDAGTDRTTVDLLHEVRDAESRHAAAISEVMTERAQSHDLAAVVRLNSGQVTGTRQNLQKLLQELTNRAGEDVQRALADSTGPITVVVWVAVAVGMTTTIGVIVLAWRLSRGAVA